MAAAELAVHAYDLATALGRSTTDLDPEVAEAGYAFMSSSMTDDMRGDAFGPEQPAPPDADAYQRIAAFAGRPVEPGVPRPRIRTNAIEPEQATDAS
jgi:hypothetical protein